MYVRSYSYTFTIYAQKLTAPNDNVTWQFEKKNPAIFIYDMKAARALMCTFNNLYHANVYLISL